MFLLLEGFRVAYLLKAPTSRPKVAIWLNATAQHKRNAFLTWWELAGTLAGQCKTDDNGQYPETPDQITSARPIMKTSVFRRLKAKSLSPKVCKAVKPIVERYGQYGLSPSGCPAIYRTAQLGEEEVSEGTTATRAVPWGIT